MPKELRTKSFSRKTGSEARRLIRFINKTRSRVRPYLASELLITFAYLGLFELVVFWGLPNFVRLEVIIPVLASMLTVEGILVGFAPHFKNEYVRNMVAVTIGLPCLLLTLLTLLVATFQSLQLKILSTDVVTILFKTSAGFLGLLAETYALGLILPGIVRKVRNPEDTEP